MSDQRFAIIDPAAGVSGDMLLGALVDVGLPREWLAGLPDRLKLDDVTIDCAEVMRAGIRATKMTVRLGGAIEGPAGGGSNRIPAGPGSDGPRRSGSRSRCSARPSCERTGRSCGG